jgi:hypothetical protein
MLDQGREAQRQKRATTAATARKLNKQRHTATSEAADAAARRAPGALGATDWQTVGHDGGAPKTPLSTAYRVVDATHTVAPPGKPGKKKEKKAGKPMTVRFVDLAGGDGARAAVASAR